MLRGNVLAKIDDKGRLKLPASFRSVIEPEFGKDFFVTSIDGNSARIYPLQKYVQLEERLRDASAVQPLVSRFRSALNFFGSSASMDGQGRILIHPLLRDKAQMEGEVAVLGQADFLEVWNRAIIERRLTEQPLTEDELRELAGFGF